MWALWIIGGIFWLIGLLVAWACCYVGGKADEEMERCMRKRGDNMKWENPELVALTSASGVSIACDDCEPGSGAEDDCTKGAGARE